jgi:hypothetical protein
MGTTTDGYLFYGYVWTDETTPAGLLARAVTGDPDADEGEGPDEWEDIILQRRGVIDPWLAYPNEDALVKVAEEATEEEREAYFKDHAYHRPKGGPGSRDYSYGMAQCGGNLYRQRPEVREAIDAFTEAKRSLPMEFGVDIDSHCSGECPMAFIHIVQTDDDGKPLDYSGFYSNSRGDAKAIDIQALAAAPTEEWDARLARFVEELGIPMEPGEYADGPEGPGWFLVSYWG